MESIFAREIFLPLRDWTKTTRKKDEAFLELDRCASGFGGKIHGWPRFPNKTSWQTSPSSGYVSMRPHRLSSPQAPCTMKRKTGWTKRIETFINVIHFPTGMTAPRPLIVRQPHSSPSFAQANFYNLLPSAPNPPPSNSLSPFIPDETQKFVIVSRIIKLSQQLFIYVWSYTAWNDVTSNG